MKMNKQMIYGRARAIFDYVINDISLTSQFSARMSIAVKGIMTFYVAPASRQKLMKISSNSHKERRKLKSFEHQSMADCPSNNQTRRAKSQFYLRSEHEKSIN
jgi:hypothetical protein